MRLCEILHLACTVMLVSQVTRAKYIREDLFDLIEDDDHIGRPSTSTSTQEQGKCNKDILIILDTSRSIGESNFNKQVKPFLRDFVSDNTLNVGPDGAQVALLLFSKFSDPNEPNYRKQSDKTKLVIPFKDNFDAEMFERYINNTEWKNIEGGHTRTDKALEIANDKVFPLESPLNNRKHSPDLIVLITDGKPTGTTTVEEDTIAYAEKLKKKGIPIIGVGVGNNIENEQFWNILQNIASPGQAIRVKFEDFLSIKNTLVKSSCENHFSPGLLCKCADIESTTIYLKPGEVSRSLSWKRPDPVCPGASETVRILDFTSEPPIHSPHVFEAGQHTINYNFYLEGNQQIKCAVKLDVRACECPSGDLQAVPVKPGDTNVDLEWQVPVPSCLDCPSPLTAQSMPVGQHSMAYKYNIGNQFNVTCKVNIEVKGALCKGNGYDQESQECCCGVIYDKKDGYECCGQDHFDIVTHHCCDGDNIRKVGEECPATF